LIGFLTVLVSRSAGAHEGGTDAARPPPERLHAIQVCDATCVSIRSCSTPPRSAVLIHSIPCV
jgi:hypothetical protein